MKNTPAGITDNMADAVEEVVDSCKMIRHLMQPKDVELMPVFDKIMDNTRPECTEEEYCYLPLDRRG